MAKILVVDDSEDVRDLTVQVLSEEHDVEAVENWDEAKEYIFNDSLDILLLDINMPNIKGDEIAEMIKNKIQYKPFKIIFFSAIDQMDLRKKTQEVGADGCIQKTLDPDLLLRQVRKLCR